MTRIEKDLLGEKEIPEDVYYGIQTARAVENFPITGYRLYPNLIVALAMVKKACAVANKRTGVVSPDIADAIVEACDVIIDGKYHEHFVVDVIQGGAGTSINMNANEVIANIAIEALGGKKGDYDLVSPNTHVNASQSTNDVFPTAIRLASLMFGDELLEAIIELKKTFGMKAREFDHIVKVGRTHLQDAVPIRLGQEFCAYKHVIARDKQRIKRSLQALLTINMGATATGTGLNSDKKYSEIVVSELRDYTGYDLSLASDLVDATQNIDVLAEISGALKILAVDLSKIANDLRLMSSGPKVGFNEINLPPVQPGSSIMPGKVNPVIPETVNQVAFQVVGNDLTITMALEAGQLELNVMEPVVAYNLFQSFQILANVIRVFARKAVKGITANEDICRKYFENSIGIITALNPYLGYEATSTLAKEALETGKPVRQLVLEKGLFDENEVDIIFSPYELTKQGIAGGAILKRPFKSAYSRRKVKT